MSYPGNIGTFRVNGGIINQQTLTGGLRFFKIVGPFGWAVSDGGVNLPVTITGGATPIETYFQVPNNAPVPGSAAEIVLQTIIQQSDIVVIGFVPSLYSATTEMDIAVSASAFGWGSDYPDYQVPPANQDEDQLPTTPTHAATELQTVIQALPNATVYVSTSMTVTSGSASGTHITLNFAAITSAVPVGSFINVTGVVSASPPGTDYNGYYKVTSSSTTSVTYASTATDAWVSGGLITANALAPETTSVSFATVSVTEVSFSLGNYTYYTLA